ncbi:MAG: hypothetical protein ABIA77_01100, partial [Candidatus Omnitrophota bacterium]
PPIEVKYRKPGDNEWQSAESPQVPIEVESLLTGEYSDIRDIKGPFFPRKKILQEAATVFALLCAGAVIWVLWRRKTRAESMEALKAKTADEIAYEELNRLREMKLPEKGEVREYYFRLSGIVRHYLENRFSYRAPEMTTEEFLGLLKNSAELKGEHKKLLKDFLSHCDMVKFAKYGSTLLEMLDSFKSAERLVDQTRGIEEEAGT